VDGNAGDGFFIATKHETPFTEKDERKIPSHWRRLIREFVILFVDGHSWNAIFVACCLEKNQI
jgi:hypothetical protein